MIRTMRTGLRASHGSRTAGVAAALFVVTCGAGAQPATTQAGAAKPKPLVVAPQQSQPPAPRAPSPLAKALATGAEAPKAASKQAQIPLGLCSGD